MTRQVGALFLILSLSFLFSLLSLSPSIAWPHSSILEPWSHQGLQLASEAGLSQSGRTSAEAWLTHLAKPGWVGWRDL